MPRMRDSFAPYWQSIQNALFPDLEQELGPLTAKQQQLVQTLEVLRIEQPEAAVTGAAFEMRVQQNPQVLPKSPAEELIETWDDRSHGFCFAGRDVALQLKGIRAGLRPEEE